MVYKTKNIKYLFLYLFCMLGGQVYAQSDAEIAEEGMFTEVFYYDTTKGSCCSTCPSEHVEQQFRCTIY